MYSERRPIILRSSDDGRGSFEDEANSSKEKVKYSTDLAAVIARVKLEMGDAWKSVKNELNEAAPSEISKRVLRFCTSLFKAYLFVFAVERVFSKLHSESYSDVIENIRKKNKFPDLDELAKTKFIILGGDVGERMDEVLRENAKKIVGGIKLD